jgi:galactonate dehydratase
LDSPDALDASVERLKEVRSVGIDLGLDFHGRLHKAMAKQLAQRLEPFKPLFIEEPLLPGHIDELKALYQQTSIPIVVSSKRIVQRNC